MKKLTLMLCAASLLLFACNNETKSDNKEGGDSTGNAKVANPDAKSSQPADPCAGQPAPDPAAMAAMDTTGTAKWMEYATPGEAHAMIAKSDGEWSGEITSWMSPDAPPMKSVGVAVNKMILGGRYQQSTHTSCFAGMPFEGISTTGYDNQKKKYFSTWVDNMGTGVMVMEGTWDAATKTLNMSGSCVDPRTGKTCKMREEFTIIDDNTQKMTMYGPDIKTGKEFKNMEILLKRKG